MRELSAKLTEGERKTYIFLFFIFSSFATQNPPPSSEGVKD